LFNDVKLGDWFSRRAGHGVMRRLRDEKQEKRGSDSVEKIGSVLDGQEERETKAINKTSEYKSTNPKSTKTGETKECGQILALEGGSRWILPSDCPTSRFPKVSGRESAFCSSILVSKATMYQTQVRCIC